MKDLAAKLLLRAVWLLLVIVTMSLMFGGSIFGFKVLTATWFAGVIVFAIIPVVMEAVASFIVRLKCK